MTVILCIAVWTIIATITALIVAPMLKRCIRVRR
jgi:hypothetical protein